MGHAFPKYLMSVLTYDVLELDIFTSAPQLNGANTNQLIKHRFAFSGSFMRDRLDLVRNGLD